MSKDRNRGRGPEREGVAEPTAPGSAPAAFLDELVCGRWTNPAFPALDRAFVVAHGPEFRRDVVAAALNGVVQLTGGRVGYVFDVPGRSPEIEFVYDPRDSGLQGSLACTYIRTAGPVVLGCRVVLGIMDGRDDFGAPRHHPDSVTMLAHELGHGVFGFGHIEGFRDNVFGPGPFVMGGLGERDWHAYERQAVAEKMAQAAHGIRGLSAPDVVTSLVSCGG